LEKFFAELVTEKATSAGDDYVHDN
jgi:hypothetical protein